MPRLKTAAAVVAAALAVALTTGHARAATPKEDVSAAVQKLADAASYTFTSTTEGGGGPGGGQSTGKVEKDGYTSVATTMGDNTRNMVRKGDKVAIQTDDGWQTPEEMQQAGGGQGGRRGGGWARMYRSPVEQAQQVLAAAPELKKAADGSYAVDLPEEAAKKLMTFGGRRGGGNAAGGGNNGPTVSDAKASATFTLKDGALTKMVLHVSGTMTFNGNDRDVDRTTTVEFKDVGSTKADVPAEAKAKLDGAAAATPTTKP